jgi:hypothetical protein
MCPSEEDRLVRAFAGEAIGVRYALDQILREPGDERHGAIRRKLDAMSFDDTNPDYRNFLSAGIWPDEATALEVYRKDQLVLELDGRLAEHRLAALLDQAGIDRPPPYDLPECQDLEVDDEQLVNLAEFGGRVGPFTRAGHSFLLMLPLPEPVSEFWLSRALRKHQACHADVRVRLDPFLHGPTDEFSFLELRAWWHGPSLDWDHIGGLSEVIRCQAGPDALSHGSIGRTDLAWVPREDGVHFLCEELPKHELIGRRAGRYFHAIYRPEESQFLHLDGALRLYSAEEYELRWATTVDRAGKAGTRMKVVRLDGEIERETFCDLLQTFFYWNRDLTAYVTGALGHDAWHAG